MSVRLTRYALNTKVMSEKLYINIFHLKAHIDIINWAKLELKQKCFELNSIIV